MANRGATVVGFSIHCMVPTTVSGEWGEIDYCKVLPVFCQALAFTCIIMCSTPFFKERHPPPNIGQNWAVSVVDPPPVEKSLFKKQVASI